MLCLGVNDRLKMCMEFSVVELADRTFGGVIDAAGHESAFMEWAVGNGSELPGLLDSANGLLVIKGLEGIRTAPSGLVALSGVFGREVENYRETPTPPTMIHESEDQILVISNLPPCERSAPKAPDPARTDSGNLPVQFPHRVGWHTDQSFRRPPPDVSLFYGVITTPHGQGQTLFADGCAAYAGLADKLKQRIAGLEGLHALLGTGRTLQAVRDGVEPLALMPHQLSQKQPLVRIHPVTGRPALFLCEHGQMDWLDGPIVGMEPGPDGEGAALLCELVAHCTREEYVYVHEWDAGDLVIYDNRCLLHCATWYDDQAFDRLMWRTTVHGNPGPEYAGETKSWIPRDASQLLGGLGDARWDNRTEKNSGR